MAVVRRKATGNSAKLLIEGKDEMRRRGIRSPDNADALALTFSLPFDLLPKLRKDDWERDFNNSFDDRGSHGWMG
jgi:hypothetical protein